jgi:hypothetical protein
VGDEEVPVPWWLTAALLALALFAVDRLLLAAERRGWIYYRTTPPRRASAGTALLSVEAIFRPEVQHVVDERAALETDEDADGEPPGP